MTRLADNLYRLRWSFALLATFILIGGGTALTEFRILRSETEVRKRAIARKDELRLGIAHASGQYLALSDEIDLYRLLDKRGVIGPEHRRDWTEKIRRTVEGHRLFEVRYEFAPQTPLDEPLEKGTGNGAEILSSRMRFEMALLHERDLLTFLSELQANVQADLRLRACSIERIQAIEQDGAPRLKATCELDWITLREKEQST